MMRIGSAIAIFIALLGLTIFAFAQQAGERIRGEPSWELLSAADARATPEVSAKLRRLLARQPLDQAKLNLLFATEAKGDLAAARRQSFTKTLNELGWRDTPTQQNLIVEAARTNDPNAAILHIDALLRRGKLTDDILPVLLQIEAVPQATALLAGRLEKHPHWRVKYLHFIAKAQNPTSVAARVRLLNRMLDDGDQLSHAELKPSLDAMVRQGLRKEALGIAMRANGSRANGELLYDPDFSKFVALPARDRENPLPFEWDARSQPGASAQIVGQGQSGQLRVRWNGNGAPIVARTMTLVQADQVPDLKVAVDSLDAASSLDEFRFELICRGQRPVTFRMGDGRISNNVATYRADGPAPCDYPDLVMRGYPQGRNASAEITIEALRLVTPERSGG